MNSLIRSLVISMLFPSAAWGQNLIANGSFELPLVPTGSNTAQTPTAWNGGSSTRILNMNGSSAILPFPQDGQQYVAVATSETLSQVFSVGVGGQYLLKWFDNAGNVPNAGLAPYSATVTSSPSQQIIGSGTFDSFHPTAWSQRSLTLNLTPGSYQLSFRAGGTNPGGLSPLFDNVSANPIVVPETSTSCLLLAFAFFASRKRWLQ